MKLNAQQTVYVTWAGLGLAAIGIGYALLKWVVPAVTKAAAGAATAAAGNLTTGAANTVNAVNQGLSSNDLTKSSTDFAGNTVDYSGHGPISTLGATANDASGGLLASLGAGVGGLFYSWFGSDYNPNASSSQSNSTAPASTTSQPGINADMGGQDFGVSNTGGW